MYAMHLETALLLKQAPPNYFGDSRQNFRASINVK